MVDVFKEAVVGSCIDLSDGFLRCSFLSALIIRMSFLVFVFLWLLWA